MTVAADLFVVAEPTREDLWAVVCYHHHEALVATHRLYLHELRWYADIDTDHGARMFGHYAGLAFRYAEMIAGAS